MEITDIMTFLNTGVIAYTLFKMNQQHSVIDKLADLLTQYIQKQKETPKENVLKTKIEHNIDYLDLDMPDDGRHRQSKLKYHIDYLDLEMTEKGWNCLSKSISSERGVYLHFGLTKDDHYVPLRIGMTAAQSGFRNRWLGAHKQAFNAVKCNDYKYIKDYPNYAFFFDDMRHIFPETLIVFVKLKYGREKILKVEEKLIKSFSPIWEEFYVKRKWKIWKDEVYSNDSIHEFINKMYIQPKINDFSKESTNNLVERIEKLIG